MVIVGLFGGEIPLATPLLPLRVLTLRGSYVGNHRDLAELVKLIDRDAIPAVPLRTRPLSEVNAALDDLRAGKMVGQVVLKDSG